MFSPRIKISLLLLAVLLLSACAQAAPVSPAVTAAPEPSPTPGTITLTDSFNKTITLAGPAQRIVSLSPATTESLFALGAGVQIVGRDTFSDYPEQAKSIPDVGGGFGELNVEAILAQKPDLVLTSALTPPEQIKALEDAGLTVYAVGNPKDFAGLYVILQNLARLSGHEKEAAILVDEIKQRVAAVEEKLAGVSQRPLVFYEIDGTDPNAVWTTGPGTFIDTLIRMAGGENLGADLQGEWVQISLEELIARDPDLILLGDAIWGGVTVESVQARAGWSALRAVQDGKIFPFDDNLVSRPGPRLVEGLEALARQFHPDLFE
jgi:iron complex transport system substrate-binding protein